MSSVDQFPIHIGKGLSQIKEYMATGKLSDIDKLKSLKATLESEVDDNGSGSSSGAIHNGKGDEDGGDSDLEDFLAHPALSVGDGSDGSDDDEDGGNNVSWPRGS